MIEYFIAGTALVGLLIGSYTDIKIREVPNRISLGLILAMLIFRFAYAIQAADMWIFYSSIIVGSLFFAMGLAFFYLGQWGGADMKLLVMLGTGFATLLPGFNPAYIAIWPFALTILLNFFVVAVVYSVLYSFILAFKNMKVWMDFKAGMNRYELFFLMFGTSAIIAAGFYISIIWGLLVIPSLYTLAKFLKAVEANCMYKNVVVNQLVEFDVPEKDIIYRKKVIVDSKNPNGMTLEQIAELKQLSEDEKIPKAVRIKWGVPLVPVFPITLIISLVVGDLFLAGLNFIWLS